MNIDCKVYFVIFGSPIDDIEGTLIVLIFWCSPVMTINLSGERYQVRSPFFLFMLYIFLIDTTGFPFIIELDFLWKDAFFHPPLLEECIISIGVNSIQLSWKSFLSENEFFESGMGHLDFQREWTFENLTSSTT